MRLDYSSSCRSLFLITRPPPSATLFPYTTLFRSLLKFMRASIKMIGVSNLQSFIASMTQKLTLSDISDESKKLCRLRSEERFSRNAETDVVCRLLLEQKKDQLQRVRCILPAAPLV